MSVLGHVKKFPVVSLPVRKQLARSGSCPDCGAGLGNVDLVCLNKDCGLDAAQLVEYRRVITVEEELAEADG